MSQYKTGTATVTNGSATVTGSGTLWLANVTAGDSFTVAGDGVMYYVASVDSDTQITLSVAYAGTTASGVVYAIGTGFTVPDSFPEMSQGDIETATIFTRAMRKIQSKFSGIAINTTAEIEQAVSDKADQATTYTETEVDELTGSLAYPNTTLASSSDISESLESPITAYPHIQGFRTGTGTALTFAQVVEEAAERGARLLTIQELEAGVAEGAGFQYNSEITWTSSPAGVGLVYGNLGDGDGTRVVLNTSTDTAAGGYAVSVIGQRQWTDTQYADKATTYTETEVDSLLDDKAAIAGQVFTGDIAAPKITASTGVLFGTDTAAANTLDDYEEGTWTVILSDESSGGNVSSGTEVGYYTKIGRIVHLNFSFKDIETGGMTGGNSLNVQNVPFTAISNVNLQSIPGSVYFNQVTLSGNDGGPVFDLSDGLTTGKFRFPISAAVAGKIKVSDIDSGRSDIRCAITYTTD